jgi:hypothetical protein
MIRALRMMNFRHAAALVVIGWYLIMPPFYRATSFIIFRITMRLEPDEAIRFTASSFNPFRTLEVHAHAPIGEWSIESRYDSATACEDAKIEEQANSGWRFEKSTTSETSTDIYFRLQSLREHESKCIATDDPRLAK